MNARSLVPLALAAALLSGCGGGTAKEGGKATTSASGSKYDAGPRAVETPYDHEQAEQGKELFSAKGCSACHAFGKRVTGPDLAGVSKRRTAEWMENQILHPEVMTKEDPIARELLGTYALQMPNQRLTPEEARAVIEFFKQHDQGAVDDDGPGDRK
jgi:mono/diheme cytochrome c family protein